eukprot:CAMPEP_0202887068 /NCGR_PEP_ID=MMETSP1391-20130828/42488_1 /ASSEMBLY_ACC=CAM_ASM_000867 /TAXON_ID=1034604 /ORGANISM="Chlamydomonas leiostraca, Strain SAG 11-49" /LENGTH=149 /DNA_ID=CAMNT_0049570343 /DNA_START=854 /DNA_END=1302 /DNA_ORIENTATION=-
MVDITVSHAIPPPGRQAAAPLQLVVGALNLTDTELTAVADVGGRGEALVLKHVAQVAAAVLARDLHAPHAVLVVLVPLHRARNLIVERGPPAPAVELVLALVQGGAAASAHVGAILIELVVLAAAWWLGALLAQDAELLCIQNGLPHIL